MVTGQNGARGGCFLTSRTYDNRGKLASLTFTPYNILFFSLSEPVPLGKSNYLLDNRSYWSYNNNIDDNSRYKMGLLGINFAEGYLKNAYISSENGMYLFKSEFNINTLAFVLEGSLFFNKFYIEISKNAYEGKEISASFSKKGFKEGITSL